jgi:hypothetical protein
MPKGVRSQTIINFEVAKEKYREEKNGQKSWIQAHRQQPVKPKEANSSVVIESARKSYPEKRDGIASSQTQTGEVQSAAKIKNHIIDVQTAQENRLVNR